MFGRNFLRLAAIIPMNLRIGEQMDGTETPKKIVALQVVEIVTDKVVHTVDVSGQSERSVERVLRGMLTNMDRERFVVREVES